jgi:hypothetical protein
MHSQVTRFLGLVALPVIIAVAVTFPIHAGAEPVSPSPDPLDDPNVLAAMKTAWAESVNGRAGIEASFRLDGSPSRYKVVPTLQTNQFRRQAIVLIPGVTFAIFHVHTAKGDPPPSPDDRRVADQYRLRMYTIHTQGIFVYDPATKETTKLRDGMRWLDAGPGSTQRVRARPPQSGDTSRGGPSHSSSK